MSAKTAFALRTTPEIKEAAKALTAVGGLSRGYIELGLDFKSINSALNTMAVVGIHEIIRLLVKEIELLKPQLACVEKLVRFLMDNPQEQHLSAQYFSPESTESRVLSKLRNLGYSLHRDALGRNVLNNLMAELQESLSAHIEAKEALQRAVL